jgi:hypothetical protein
LSIVKSGGRAYVAGANYLINPNHPSTVVENPVNVSKIYRSYTSGSTQIFDTGTSTSGYTVLDPTKRVDTATGLLTPVATNKYSLQRVFWVPNSPRAAFIVYYGNAQYDSLIDALNAKDTEPFVESAYTATNAIFLGWIAITGGASSLTNPADATIAPAGIFRSIGGIGSTGTTPLSTTLASLSDVSVGSRTAGDLLYYNGSQWESTKNLNATYGITGSLSIVGSLNINGTSYTAATSGTSGTSGTPGSSGTSGTSGITGDSGSSGTSGTSGTSGITGDSGSSGTSGTAGTSGTGFSSISNFGDNRILTSDGTNNAAVAESNLSFDGSTLSVTGSINMGTGSVVNPLLTGYYETMVSKSVANDFGGGIVNIDLRQGNVYKLKLDGSVLDFNIQNNPTSLQAGTFTLVLEGDGTARAFNWGTEVTWPNGAPAIVSGSGVIDVYSFVSFNSGTEYLGLVITQNQTGLV